MKIKKIIFVLIMFLIVFNPKFKVLLCWLSLVGINRFANLGISVVLSVTLLINAYFLMRVFYFIKHLRRLVICKIGR